MTASELRNQILAQAADDEAFRARLLEDPRMALREDYDIVLPENMTLKVHEDTATTAHLVLPPSKKLTDEELEAAAGGGYY